MLIRESIGSEYDGYWRTQEFLDQAGWSLECLDTMLLDLG
jgi:hypothetical protein